MKTIEILKLMCNKKNDGAVYGEMLYVDHHKMSINEIEKYINSGVYYFKVENGELIIKSSISIK